MLLLLPKTAFRVFHSPRKNRPYNETVILAASLTLLTALTADPWPLERQDRFGTAQALSGMSSGYSTPWRQYDVGGGFISSHGPSIDANGVGYFGRWVDNTFRRFDISTGTITGTIAMGNFVASTPAISGNRIFVSTDNAAGRVFGIDRTTMFTDWLENTGYVAGSPNIGPEGDVVYGTLSGVVTRRDPATGAAVWTKTGYPSAVKGPVVFTRDDQSVIFSHGNAVTAFNWADGTPLWTFNTPAAAGAPGVAPDGTIVFGTEGGRIYALNPSGTQKWLRFAADHVRAAPAFGLSGEVYVGSYDFALYAFTTATGSPLWSFFSSHWINSPASVGHDGRIYFHNRIGDLYCLSPAGSQIWMRKLGEESRGPLSIGPDSTLYVPYAGNTGSGLTSIRQDLPTLYFNPVSFNPGISGVGDPNALRTADGNTYDVQSGATQPIASEIIADFETVAPKSQLDSLAIDLKLTPFGSGNLIFVPQIYDFANNSWQSVTKRPLIPGTPLTLTLTFTGNPSNAVDPSTKLIRVRFLASRFARPVGQWGLRVDQLTARVVPKF